MRNVSTVINVSSKYDYDVATYLCSIGVKLYWFPMTEQCGYMGHPDNMASIPNSTINFMKNIYYIILSVICLLFTGCNNKAQVPTDSIKDSVEIKAEDFEDQYGLPRYLNHVAGHNESDNIVGNFTGVGLDTIFIEEREVEGEDDYLGLGVKFFAVSSNPAIPEIEIFGCPSDPPLIVLEGDVDGDGRDEWGYLHTWQTSQWRQYRIYNYNPKNNAWRFLFYDNKNTDFLETCESFRRTGLDIVEKGPRPGLIKINYMTNGVDAEIRDTIIAPTYTPINIKNW